MGKKENLIFMSTDDSEYALEVYTELENYNSALEDLYLLNEEDVSENRIGEFQDYQYKQQYLKNILSERFLLLQKSFYSKEMVHLLQRIETQHVLSFDELSEWRTAILFFYTENVSMKNYRKNQFMPQIMLKPYTLMRDELLQFEEHQNEDVKAIVHMIKEKSMLLGNNLSNSKHEKIISKK